MRASEFTQFYKLENEDEDEDNFMTLEQLVESIASLEADLSEEESKLKKLKTRLDSTQGEEEYRKLLQQVHLAEEIITSLKDVIRITREEISIVEAESGSSKGELKQLEHSDQQPHCDIQ